MLISPKMRKVYEDNFEFASVKQTTPNIFLVIKQGVLDEQISFLEYARSVLKNAKITRSCSSLQEALDISNYWDTIYIPSGRHQVKFLESFNGGGMIKALQDINENKSNPVITAREGEIVLFRIDGDFTFESVTLDCSNVSSGIVIPRGDVAFNNCAILDHSGSESKPAFVIYSGGKLTLDNSTINNFGTGISMKSGSELNVTGDSIIGNCSIGIEAEDECVLNLNEGCIVESKECGIMLETVSNDMQDDTIICYQKLVEVKNCKNLHYEKEFTFKNNQKNRNIVVSKRNIWEQFEKNCDEENSFQSHANDDDEFLGFEDCNDSVVCLN